MGISDLTLEQFRQRNRIADDTWTAARTDWSALQAIARDYERRASELTGVAELHARLLQKCSAVHSVRWRVKDAEHVLEKIVRKRAQRSEKYEAIDHLTYTRVLSDLVGIRALHLFKADWQLIHIFLSERWTHSEVPIAYVREGDSHEVRDSYAAAACRVENHPAGYRSVHYIVSSRPQKDDILAEVQVRTLFEEGWSEIDHRVRYPNFSDNQLIQLFLATFNRIAGSADELGGFVRALSTELHRYETDQKKSNAELNQHVSKIQELVTALTTQKEKSALQGKQLQQLTDEAARLRLATAVLQPPSQPWSDGHLNLEDRHAAIQAAREGRPLPAYKETLPSLEEMVRATAKFRALNSQVMTSPRVADGAVSDPISEQARKRGSPRGA